MTSQSSFGTMRVIDAVRCAKLALDRKIGGPLECCIRLHDEAPAEAKCATAKHLLNSRDSSRAMA